MTTLQLRDSHAGADLATFAGRASRHDAQAVIRVVAEGSTAAFFASTVFDAYALRTVALAATVHPPVDVVVEAVGLAARAAGAHPELALPPALPALRWIGPLPPRSGWQVIGTLASADVVATVEAGVAEFRARVAAQAENGISVAAARAAMESVAADVWGRDLLRDATASDAPSASRAGDADVDASSAAEARLGDASAGSTAADPRLGSPGTADPRLGDPSLDPRLGSPGTADPRLGDTWAPAAGLGDTGTGAPRPRDGGAGAARLAGTGAGGLGSGATVGLAHAAHSFGFLAQTGDVVVRAAGAWRRLDGAFGTVLGRGDDPLGLLG